MAKFLVELLKGAKWMAIALGVLSALVAGWVGSAWTIGWAINHFFDVRNFGPNVYLAYGSCVMVFTVIILLVTLILTGWVMLAFGKSNGFIGKKPNA